MASALLGILFVETLNALEFIELAKFVFFSPFFCWFLSMLAYGGAVKV